MLAHINHVSNNILASWLWKYATPNQLSQYTQTIKSGMSWIADDTLSNCNLNDHLGTTIGHTLGLYTTPHSQ
jgi:hypothetical protein